MKTPILIPISFIALCLAASACGSSSSERSVENYCDRLVSETDRLNEKYEVRARAASGDPLAGLFAATVSAIEVVGDLATLSESLAEVAPEEVRVEHEVVAENLRSQIDNMAGSASSPFGAIFASLILGAADNGSFVAVDEFAQDNCGMQLFGSAQVTTALVEDSSGNTVVRDVVPSFEDTGDLLVGTGLEPRVWATRTAGGLTCAGGSGGYTYATTELVDTIGGFEAELRLYWADSVLTPTQAHQETVEECPWEPVVDVEVDHPDGLTIEANQYGDTYNAYMSNGTVFATLNYAVNSTPDTGRFAEVASHISYSLAGINRHGDSSEVAAPTDLLVRADGIIDLEPVASRHCAFQPSRWEWASPQLLLLWCQTSTFGSDDEVSSLHMFDLETFQRRWSYQVAPEARFIDDRTTVAASESLVAMSTFYETEASGLTAGSSGYRLIVLDARAGNVVMDEPYPADDEDGTQLVHHVSAVGSDRVWTNSFRGPVYSVDPFSAEFAGRPGDIRFDDSTTLSPTATFGDGVLVYNFDNDELELLNMSTGAPTATTFTTRRDICDTRRPAADGSFVSISGATGSFPDSARGGFGLSDGWLVVDNDVFLINDDGSERWRIDANALRSRSYRNGVLMVTNTNQEEFRIDIATGEIAEETAEVFGETVPGANFALGENELRPLSEPACLTVR